MQTEDTYAYQVGMSWFNLLQMRQDDIRFQELFTSAQLKDILMLKKNKALHQNTRVHNAAHTSFDIYNLLSLLPS